MVGVPDIGGYEMGILDSMRGRSTTDFAKQLALDLSAHYPPSLDQSPQKRVSVNRMTRILEDAFSRAESFKNDKQLGWLGKARLGNSFRWELKELGYSDQFIEMATEGLVVYITRKAESNSASPPAT